LKTEVNAPEGRSSQDEPFCRAGDFRGTAFTLLREKNYKTYLLFWVSAVIVTAQTGEASSQISAAFFAEDTSISSPFTCNQIKILL